MNTCMKALKEVSKVWLVAKMVHTLFESILGNKSLEERLQKAPGRKHVRTKGSQSRNALPSSRSSQQQQQQMQTQQSQQPPEAQKRKFEELEMSYSHGAPSAQMSYERSRPQTPSMTPSRDLPQQPPQQHQPQQAMPAITNPQQNPSPTLPRNDTFMGASRNITRQGTPFNDLYLITRNSPTISPDVFNNFQPDQLFPAETNLQIPNFSPPSNLIDPALSTPGPSEPPSAMSMQPPTTPGSGNPLQHQHQHQQPPTPQTQPGQQQGFPPMTHRGSMQSNPNHDMNGMHVQQHQVHSPLNGMTTPTQNDWAQQLHAMNSTPQQGLGQAHPQMQDDNWSNSSMSQGPTVPTALNVEDWFQFFGIHGAPGGQQEIPQGFG